MRAILEILFPSTIDNNIHGSRLPIIIFTLYAIVSTIRSCIHLFAPDGGAGSIAGMDLTVAGANEVIFAFALWGSSQLLLALIQVLVVIRYRSLVPFMYILLILEVLLRELVGYLKPVTFDHTPPGAIGNHIVLLLSVLMLILSLWSAINQTNKKNRKV
jgi:hypothetical protein